MLLKHTVHRAVYVGVYVYATVGCLLDAREAGFVRHLATALHATRVLRPMTTIEHMMGIVCSLEAGKSQAETLAGI